MRLFAYGELCRAAVLRDQLGRLPCATVAVLADHVRRRNPATGHFEIHPAPGGRVAGLLLVDITPAETQRLDAYEHVDAGLYRRAGVRVTALEPPAAEVQAQAYLGGHAWGEVAR